MSSFLQPGKGPENDMSLNDVLSTPGMKTELVAVVALCSDAMRRQLLAVFEPAVYQQRGAAEAEIDNISTLMGSENQDRPIEDRRRAAKEAEKADLASARTQGLRRAAVTHFDKWQIEVLRRVGEVLSVRPDAIRKARADAKAGAEAAAKSRRDKEYWKWAHGNENTDMDDPGAESTDEANILPDGFRAKILQLPKEKRIIVLDSVLLLLLSLEQYSAQSRVLMLNLTRVFELPEGTLIENESKVAEGLLATAAAKMCADESTERQASEDAGSRRWKIGLATVAGAALIGVTGGLAAPVLAAGLGGIMGGLGLGALATLLGPLATNMVLVGGLFGAFGGRMTGNIMEKYAQEIKDFEFIPVAAASTKPGIRRDVSNEDQLGRAQLQDPDTRNLHKLRVVIGISGSVTDPEDFVSPWKVFSESKIEAFGLRWELEALLQLGQKISEVLQSYAWDFAKYQLLSMLLAGLWPFGLLRAARMLDSPFAIAKTRSDKAGKVLADALVNKVQGARPVTLVGYGLGARVIYSCLLQLAEQNAFGIVESAVFLGAPTPSNASSWRRIRAVVGGRVVNVFSSDDFILGFLYRTTSAQLGIAGLENVQRVSGVENYDFTDMIKGHNTYRHLVGTILQRVGFADLDQDIVRQQQDALKQVESDRKSAESKKRPHRERSQSQSLSKEDENGQIILIDEEASSLLSTRTRTSRPMSTTASTSRILGTTEEEIDDDDEINHTIQMEDNDEPLAVLQPEPEPDCGPDRETVKFGTDSRGFNIEWNSTSH